MPGKAMQSRLYGRADPARQENTASPPYFDYKFAGLLQHRAQGLRKTLGLRARRCGAMRRSAPSVESGNRVCLHAASIIIAIDNNDFGTDGTPRGNGHLAIEWFRHLNIPCIYQGHQLVWQL